MYEIRCMLTGDRAEALSLNGAMLAARTLVRDAADVGIQSRRRAARESLLVIREGRYDGLATTMARQA